MKEALAFERLDERGLIGSFEIGAAGDQNVRACGGADFGGVGRRTEGKTRLGAQGGLPESAGKEPRRGRKIQ